MLHFGRKVLRVVVLKGKPWNKRHVTRITTQAAHIDCTFASYSVELFATIKFISDTTSNTVTALSPLGLVVKF